MKQDQGAALYCIPQNWRWSLSYGHCGSTPQQSHLHVCEIAPVHQRCCQRGQFQHKHTCGSYLAQVGWFILPPRLRVHHVPAGLPALKKSIFAALDFRSEACDTHGLTVDRLSNAVDRCAGQSDCGITACCDNPPQDRVVESANPALNYRSTGNALLGLNDRSAPPDDVSRRSSTVTAELIHEVSKCLFRPKLIKKMPELLLNGQPPLAVHGLVKCG